MLDLINVGRIALGDKPGVALLLFFFFGVAVWAYWKEKKRNDSIQDERLADAKEDIRAMTEALMEAKNAIEGFKSTLEVVASHLREGVPCPYGRSSLPKEKEQ